MTRDQNGIETQNLDPWEKELYYDHRWGDPFWARLGNPHRAADEHARLRPLWQAAQPLDGSCKELIPQIISLEICNWRLQESILWLCAAIGAKKKSEHPIGHMASMTNERWLKAWAYYLALRTWLPTNMIPSIGQKRSGYHVLLALCDPDGAIQKHVQQMLDERTELKELYVELFCLRLGRWFGGWWERNHVQMIGFQAAAEALEAQIKRHDYDAEILHYIGSNLQLCHCKLFRRYDIIISSIGALNWRGAMPIQGTGRGERYRLLEGYLSGIQAWIDDQETPEGREGDATSDQIHALLGQQDAARILLASLFVSLLRSQQRWGANA